MTKKIDLACFLFLYHLILGICEHKNATIRENNKTDMKLSKYACSLSEFASICEKYEGNRKYIDSTYVHIVFFDRDANVFRHYLWSDAGNPHLLITSSKEECELKISFEDMSNGKFENIAKLFARQTDGKYEDCKLTEKFRMITMNRIIEFFNVDKNAEISDILNLGNLFLKLINTKEDCNGKVCEVINFSSKDDTVTLESVIHVENGSEIYPPYLEYGPDINVMTLKIRNRDVKYLNSVFGVEMIVESQETSSEFIEKTTDFFSDVKNPGVFRSVQISQRSTSSNAFLFWKAAAYSKPDLSRVSQVTASHEKNISDCERKDDFQNGLPVILGLNKFETAKCVTTLFKVINEDTAFKQTNFIQWSFTFGFNDYSVDVVPWDVISVIISAYSLCIVLLIVFGIVSIACRNRWKNLADDDNRIVDITDDDDLGLIVSSTTEEDEFLQ